MNFQFIKKEAAIAASFYNASTNNATPMPPPTQRDAIPFSKPLLLNS